jgi:hypothetical protein
MKTILLISWYLLIVPSVLLSQTLDQKLMLVSNSGFNGGDFIVDYQIRGTNLPLAKTVASLIADIIYDTTMLKFKGGSNWQTFINDTNGYLKSIQSNNSEQSKYQAIRIAVMAYGVNANPQDSVKGYNLEDNFFTVVRINFTILNQASNATLTIKSITNQAGLFVNPNNRPNSFDITAITLSPPVIIVDQPMPVELLSFNSSVNKNNVYLSWKTGSEQNNKGFGIERKTINESWNEVGFVNGKGNTNTEQSYNFENKDISSGSYNYRLKQTDYNGNYKYFNLNGAVSISTPSKYSVSQNYPNPFNPVTKIDYEVASDSKIKISIFDITGRELQTLLNERKPAGYYSLTFNAGNLSSGTYFYRVIADEGNPKFAEIKKMILIK